MLRFGYNRSMSEVHKRGPHWFRYSLRTFLVIVCVLCVALAVLAARANRQERAVARLKEVGAVARYDYEERFARHGPPNLPWLRKLLGIHYFDTVIIVFFLGDMAQPEDVEILHELPEVRFVNLEQSSLTAEALVHLTGLPSLRSVGIGGANATDRALENLSELSQLESLSVAFINLPGSTITDQGLVHVAKMTNLSRLALNNSPITDAGLVHLGGLTKLETLSLCGTRVTARAVAKLHDVLPHCQIQYGNRKRPTVIQPIP